MDNSFGIPFWFCCLQPVERAVLRAMGLAFVAGLGQPVDNLLWQSFWGLLVSGRASRQRAFLDIFPLEEQDATPPDTIEVVTVFAFTDTAFWLAVSAYLLNPDSACLSGCGRWYPS